MRFSHSISVTGSSLYDSVKFSQSEYTIPSQNMEEQLLKLSFEPCLGQAA